jgi:hypothetical protein
MEYTIVMKFRERYEAIRIEAESAAKAAFSAAKSSHILTNPLFVGCFTNDEILNFIQEHAGKKSTRRNNSLNMLIEEKTKDCLESNTILISSSNGDITCEEDILKTIFLEFTRSRKTTRVILGETLPTIKFEAYDRDGWSAYINMDID